MSVVRQRHISGADELTELDESTNENLLKESEETDKVLEKSTVLERLWKRLSFLKYIFLILVIPPVLNYAALKRERTHLFPHGGELVDMGWGQKLFIKCQGQGQPTVILDAPLSSSSELWFRVQEKLSKITRVCVYDRAGLGFSDVPSINGYQNQNNGDRKFVSQVSTLNQMTSDLHHLITVAKPLRRPFIFVGSEIGALIARHYTLLHPEDVLHIVLVNPLVEDLFWRQKEDWNNFLNHNMIPSMETLQLSAYIGISRIAILIGHLQSNISGDSTPSEADLIQLSHWCNGHHVGAVLLEYYHLNTSFSQMSELWAKVPFPKNVSVSVINSQKYDKFPSKLLKAWELSQLYLRQSLHPLAKHYIAEGAQYELFRDPYTLVNVVQSLVFQSQISLNVLPTVHTFHETYSQR